MMDLVGDLLNAKTAANRSGSSQDAERSGCFDEAYYVSQLDGKTMGHTGGAYQHYLQTGWRDNLQPHVLFSGAFYKENYSDVRIADIEPLAHYLEYGWREGRQPHPLVDASRLRAELEQIAQCTLDAPLLSAYISDPKFWNVSPTCLFDAEYYAAGFKDALPAMPLLVHYLLVGWKNGRQPHPLFSPDYYLKMNSDVIEAGIEPLTHFARFGQHEMRVTHPLLNLEEYQHRVGGCGSQHPLLHYIAHDGLIPAAGWLDEVEMRSQMSNIDGKSFEGAALHAYLRYPKYREINPTALFDFGYYHRNGAPEKCDPPLVDYLVYGAPLGINPHPLVDERWYKKQFEVPDHESALASYLCTTYNYGYSPTIYFDEKYYKACNPSVHGPGLLHYLKQGEENSQRPTPWFSPLYYRNVVQRDLPPSTALRHFAEHGDENGSRPSPEFDPIHYRSAYYYALETMSALKHFLVHGRYYGFLPLRARQIGKKTSDWLLDRMQRASSSGLTKSASSVSWLALGDSFDENARKLLLKEASAYSGASIQISSLGKAVSKTSLLQYLSNLNEQGYLAIMQFDCIISQNDIQILVAHLDQNLKDAAVVPLAVARDFSLVNPPRNLDGSQLAPVGDIDHPEYNFRREVLVDGSPVAMFRIGAIKRVVQTMSDKENVSLDSLLTCFGTQSSTGVYLAAGAAVSVDSAQHSNFLAPVRVTSPKRKILYVDSTIPRPDKDAGSDTAWRVLQLMQSMGFDVTFVPATVEAAHSKYISAVQKLGVRVLYPPYLRCISSFIRETTEVFDIAFMARAPVVADLFELVRAKWADCRIIFNTVDVHYLRMEREAALVGDDLLLAEAKAMKTTEINLINSADETIVLSEVELQILRKEGVEAPIAVVPPVYDAASCAPYEPASRSGVFFVGGYGHVPNIDAVDYFMKEIWPLVTAKRSDIVFHIIGADAPSYFDSYASDTVKVVGYVENLDLHLDKMRLMVSPLRYGAGIKVKVIASLSAGIPVIATSPSVEGIGFAAGNGYIVADTDRDIADKIISLYDDHATLCRLSEVGQLAVRQRYSINSLTTEYRRLLK